jgi:hypothetical protein
MTVAPFLVNGMMDQAVVKEIIGANRSAIANPRVQDQALDATVVELTPHPQTQVRPLRGTKCRNL